jgi:hypothetical protein
VNQDRVPAGTCSTIEREQASLNSEWWFIPGKEYLSEKSALSYEGLSAVADGLVGLCAFKPRARTGAQPAGVEPTPPAELEPDPVDPWQRGMVDGAHPAY